MQRDFSGFKSCIFCFFNRVLIFTSGNGVGAGVVGGLVVPAAIWVALTAVALRARVHKSALSVATTDVSICPVPLKNPFCLTTGPFTASAYDLVFQIAFSVGFL